jgi:hypothetical protein
MNSGIILLPGKWELDFPVKLRANALGNFFPSLERGCRTYVPWSEFRQGKNLEAVGANHATVGRIFHWNNGNSEDLSTKDSWSDNFSLHHETLFLEAVAKPRW